MTRHSSFLSDRDALRTMLRRAAVASVDDQGTQQTLNLAGLAGDAPRNVPRIESFGLASNPPAGGNGLIVCPGGRSDKAMFLGGEHPKYRPTGTESGGTILYDANGQTVSLIKNNVRIIGTQTITIQAPTINLVGEVSLGGAGATVPVELSNSTASTKVKAV